MRTFEAVLFALFLTVALLAWRMSKGPIPLDVLAPYIENALVSAQPDLRLKIGHASLRWVGLSERPVLTFEDVRAIDRSGVIAALPRMVVQISVAALLRGALVPEQIALSSPILRLARRVDGTFALGFEGGGETDTGPTDSSVLAAAMMEALTGPASDTNRVGYLAGVSIENTTLIVLDEASGRRWLVPNAALALRRSGGDVLLSATLPVIDDDRQWMMKATGRYVANTRTLDMTLTMDGFQPSRIAGLAQQLSPLSALDLSLNGEVSATLTLQEKAANLESVRFDLKGDHGTLHIPDPVNRDYEVRRLDLKGSITHALDRITLDSFRLELDGAEGMAPVISMTGLADRLNSAPSVTADLGIDAISLAALKQYWPPGVKENTRNWITNNLTIGGLTGTKFHFALAGQDLDTLKLAELKGSSALNDVSVQYMRGMPKVEKTDAALSITSGEVSMQISNGVVPDAMSGKGIRVRGGEIRMTNLGSDHEHAKVTLDLAGEFGEVMRLIDNPPLGYASAMGVDPLRVSGAATVALEFNFPLISDLKLEQLDIAVKAKVDGGKVPNVAFGQPMTDSHLAMVLDRKGMDVTGSVALAGIPATLKWRENFGGGDFRSRYEIDTTLNTVDRPVVGLSAMIFAAPYFEGPAQAHVIYTSHRDGTGTVEADANLEGATLAIPQLGWKKEPGKAAHATTTAIVVKDQVREIQAFHLKAGETEIAGSAGFNANAVLKSLVLTKADVDETRLTGELALDESGSYVFDVSGTAFNSTYFWKELNRDDARGSAEQQAKTPMTVHAAFNRMWLTKEGEFQDVQLTYRQSSRGIEQIDLTTNVDGATAFTFNLGSRDGKRVFHGFSNAGGAVVRAAGLYPDIVGGTLQIDGEFAADGSVKGKADIANLKLIQAPALARLLSVAALTGIVDELRGKGISFKLLRMPFTYANSKLRVTDGEMFGTALGLTAKGTYSFPDSMMDFDGTIIPAYAINNALASIPLIGALLTGTEKGGGILAATYRYQGNVATAEPSVNPLAALTPGITRRIFNIFRGSSQSSTAPARPPTANPAPPSEG